MSSDARFVMESLSEIGRVLLEVIEGGRVETARDLGPVLPTGVAIEIEARTLKSAQRLKAQANAGDGS